MSESRLDALIIGHAGQDGTLLQEQLEQQGLSWAGISRSRSAGSSEHPPAWYDVSDKHAVRAKIDELRPKHVYYLAAAHGGSSDTQSVELGDRYEAEIAVNTLGVIHHLEAIRRVSPDTRLLFASSSLVFAPTTDPKTYITEDTPFAPAEPYAVQKMLAGLACRDFRREHSLFVSVAYLFNHESIYRRPGYFTSQIVAGISKILSGASDHLEVGDLNAIVDWSFAGDTVMGMRLALERDVADDYVIASGVGHTIREFLEVAFDYAGLELDEHIKVNPALLRRTNSCRVGDAGRLREQAGWQPQMGFEALVRHLMAGSPAIPAKARGDGHRPPTAGRIRADTSAHDESGNLP